MNLLFGLFLPIKILFLKLQTSKLKLSASVQVEPIIEIIRTSTCTIPARTREPSWIQQLVCPALTRGNALSQIDTAMCPCRKPELNLHARFPEEEVLAHLHEHIRTQGNRVRLSCRYNQIENVAEDG